VMEGVGVNSDNFMSKNRIKVTIIGKPNTGKSSLVNRLLESERVAVNDQPHTTTDPIGVDFVREGIKFRLTDTAGLESHSHLKVGIIKSV
jgi:GTP-binding protein